jgi:hypothetical protein
MGVEKCQRELLARMLKQYRAEVEKEARRREASERAKRWRAVRAAAGDTRPTWISCPHAPTAPERLAA